ncbi:MAG: helicase-associated domain-containing protein, partial [Chloroflexota bacterium]
AECHPLFESVMPDLVQSLQNYDIGHLRIVAGLWGVELPSPETDEALQELSAALLNPEMVSETIDILPSDARSALDALVESDGKLPWATFSRKFGEIREAGPGRRDREQIYCHPISAAETLFYRALLARAFFDTPSGAQEFAYIPEDLLELIKRESPFTPTPLPAPFGGASRGDGQRVREDPLGRPATPQERQHPFPASDRLLDDATTFLAALRMGLVPPEMRIPVEVIRLLLEAARVIVKSLPQTETVKRFLEMPRGEALSMLAQAWQASKVFNELRLLPGLQCEGEWTNQPLATREFLLGLLEAIPEEKWWSLPAFVQDIKKRFPDFQRPSGDYDSWFIKRTSDGTYLRGFANWDEVDGALIRYIITGPLFWLGKVDLATPVDSEIITAFRVNKKQVESIENGKLTVASNGRISVPWLVPRVTRYLIARFCDWDDEKSEEYRYRVSTRSLKKAGEQGLKAGQLLSLLAKNAAAEIPPAFVKALKRWEARGTEARVETQTILRVSRPEVLAELRKSKAARFLSESLGSTAVVVKPGAQSKVMAALVELGLLAEMPDSE